MTSGSPSPLSTLAGPGARRADLHLHNLEAITAACDEPGPFIDEVYERRILRLAL